MNQRVLFSKNSKDGGPQKKIPQRHTPSRWDHLLYLFFCAFVHGWRFRSLFWDCATVTLALRFCQAKCVVCSSKTNVPILMRPLILWTFLRTALSKNRRFANVLKGSFQGDFQTCLPSVFRTFKFIKLSVDIFFFFFFFGKRSSEISPS